MKLTKFLLAALALCIFSASVGCGKTAEDDKKDAENMQAEAKGRQKRMLKNSMTLLFSGINVYQTSHVQSDIWNNLSDDDRTLTKKRLMSVARDARRILEIEEHKNMRFEGTLADQEKSRDALRTMKSQASAYLHSLKEWEESRVRHNG